MHMRLNKNHKYFKCISPPTRKENLYPRFLSKLKGLKKRRLNFSFLIPISYERAYRMLKFVVTKGWIKSFTINCGQAKSLAVSHPLCEDDTFL